MAEFNQSGLTAGYGVILHHLDNTTNYLQMDSEICPNKSLYLPVLQLLQSVSTVCPIASLYLPATHEAQAAVPLA